ncbi:MAG: hypothetical protein DRN53_06690, partial [Thermoprotei archaeon]
MSSKDIPTLTSLEIKVLVRELKQTLSGARISNIYQVSDDIFTIKLHIPSVGERELLMWIGKAIFLSSHSVPHPKRPPAICMQLRRHLRGALIVDIEQYDMDRIIDIRLVKSNRRYLLVIEIIREGNIVLVDEETNRIIAAHKYKRMRDRDIIPGGIYRRPPPRGIDPFSKEVLDALSSVINSEKGVFNVLMKYLNVPPELIREACERRGIDPKEKTYIVHDQIYGILDEIRELIKKVDEDPTPLVITTKSGELKLRTLEFMIDKEVSSKEYFPSLNAAIENVYFKRILEKIKASTTARSRKLLEDMYRKIEAQKRALREVEERVQVLFRVARVLSTHLHTIQEIIEKVSEMIMNKKLEEAQVLVRSTLKNILKRDVQVKILPDKKIVQITVNSAKIQLDPKLSAGVNISRIYDEVKSLRKSSERIRHAIEETRKRIEELEKEVIEVEESIEEKVTRRDKAWYERFRWFITSNGFLVIAGRDRKQNEVIVKKYMEPHDIVLHADIYGSPITTIKTGGKNVSSKDIEEAAEFTAVFSRAWREGLACIDV